MRQQQGGPGASVATAQQQEQQQQQAAKRGPAGSTDAGGGGGGGGVAGASELVAHSGVAAMAQELFPVLLPHIRWVGSGRRWVAGGGQLSALYMCSDPRGMVGGARGEAGAAGSCSTCGGVRDGRWWVVGMPVPCT